MAEKFRLLVEGKDDEHVLYQILEHHRLPQTFRIIDKKGIDNLLETLDVELIAGGLERLGVVVDADARLQPRWESLRNIFVQNGYTEFPAQPDSAGTVVRQKGKRIGVWIMPDNVAAGMLEDFVGLLVPPGDILWAFAQECITEIVAQDCRFPRVHRSKALIHTWLAWQEHPGSPMGLAIKNSRLNPDAVAALPLVDWLRAMFEAG